MRPLLFLGAGLLLTANLSAAPARFSSATNRTSVIELFTSEGCSSCPPAERQLADLRDAPGLWRDFVPVAWHVDYWNRLGWPDRFATREFTRRQYDFAAAWGTGKVYTPCLVRDGAEMDDAWPVSPARTIAGRLTVEYDGTMLRAGFFPMTPHAVDAFEVHAAILGGGISSSVTAGENRGATLRHEFVALALASAPLGRDLPLAVPKIAGVTRHALAVWVTRRGEMTPLQATGGWLD